MLKRRLLSLVLVLPLAACGSAAGSGPVTPPPAPATPRDALVASVSGIRAGNYAFDLRNSNGAGLTGSMHLPSGSAQWSTSGGNFSSEVRVVGRDRFTRSDFTFGGSAPADDGAGWDRVDAATPPGPGEFYDLADPDWVGVGPLLEAANSAEGASPTIKGTVDLTKVRNSNKLVGLGKLHGLAPGTGTAAPYVATLDAKGRLVKLELDVPAMVPIPPAEKWTFEFSAYGSARPARSPLR
ncbi:hypothetical protein [Actinoplanes sp. NBRC 103695]|uniref:hypothetical protein n=1 Tax=Actinoplanes sp. NBRC 103695 TaxID=3032202 RepID=UPI0024A49E77|nr:hypothetical protein [Actinoplanes sp. NBRC 103695]GLY95325.1 hypothetical protein Acsp02_25800 [Actinoplanes sp. NBRC 103695]